MDCDEAGSLRIFRPATLSEACTLLTDEEETRIIAGGQTLVPMMAMRLLRPTRLIDIGRIAELAYLRDEGDYVAIGAATRQWPDGSKFARGRKTAAAGKSHAVCRSCPDPGAARSGGSLANADPGGRDCAYRRDAGARLGYREGTHDTEVPAAEFFIGAMTTALPAAACLTSARFPVWNEQRLGVGFHEVNARRGDFAFVTAAAQVALQPDGACRRVTLGIGAATDFPIRLGTAERTWTLGISFFRLGLHQRPLPMQIDEVHQLDAARFTSSGVSKQSGVRSGLVMPHIRQHHRIGIDLAQQ